ncbi:MAG: tRNA (guanosine(46)-N7)-methyltransferase TrmB [SAR86 cluster bacterium]|nr:tRNA (guanosine(46)-N7)-methyltransferase TrmB [SAR86 cluster bacterium]
MERKLKSFVLHGRMTRAQGYAIKNYWHIFGISNENTKDLDQIFGRRAKKVLDIGFGAGETLIDLAQNNLEKDFIGIEVHKPGIGSLISKINKLSLKNIRVVQQDADIYLQELSNKNKFEAVILFYPDPWPKRKHKKRRLVNEEFIIKLERVLENKGILICKTDWKDYGEQIYNLLSSNKNWIELSYPQLPSDFKFFTETNFEKKAKLEGRESNFLLFKKV